MKPELQDLRARRGQQELRVQVLLELLALLGMLDQPEPPEQLARPAQEAMVRQAQQVAPAQLGQREQPEREVTGPQERRVPLGRPAQQAPQELPGLQALQAQPEERVQLGRREQQDQGQLERQALLGLLSRVLQAPPETQVRQVPQVVPALLELLARQEPLARTRP